MTEERGSNINLTRNQQLIWTEQLLYPDVPLYNEVWAFHIAGSIDLGSFRRAFQSFVDGTDIFRTVISEQDGVPQQHVFAEFPYEVELVDLTNESNPNAALEMWLHERSARRFDLGSCLFESVLLKVGREYTVWYMNQHHLITDGWSASLVYSRVAQAYSQAIEDRLESVSYPSFKDFVREENTYHNSRKYEKDKHYWKEKLRKPLEPICFYGRTTHLQKISRSVRIRRSLGSERSLKLRARASQPNIAALTPDLTMFHIFSAILLAYLYRISGNRELSIGTPFHNRSSKVLYETAGLLMNVVPLYVNIESGVTFISLIQQLRNESYSALPYCRYAPGNPIHRRAYEVILNYHNSFYKDFCGMPTRKEWIHAGWATESVSLQIHQFGSSEDYEIDFDLNEDTFDLQQRERALDHFFRILDGFIDDEEQSIENVDILEPGERTLIMEVFNHTGTMDPVAHTVIEQFGAQVERTPKAIAVVFEDEQLTYRDLNNRANQLANYLRKQGVGPDVLVGICMERCLEMVIGILGILKAGGACVPMDRSYPTERLTFMMVDAQVPIILTTKNLVDKIPHHGAKIVCLSDEEIIREQVKENHFTTTTPDNLVYVIYTSGSTGQPKGVALPHRAISNLISWQLKNTTLSGGARTLQFTSLSFDVSFQEIFVSLCSGGSLIMMTESIRQDIEQVAIFIAYKNIDRLFLPFVALQQLAEVIQRNNLCIGLREVITAGEQLRITPAIYELFSQMKECSFYNQYGPSESHVVTSYALGDSPKDWSYLPPIGRPIDNTIVYITDSNLQSVPIGVTGELLIGGVGLGREYLNLPELTREKFISNPFSKDPKDRLYKTGDLVRYLPDGNIEFLGRIDNQVKIRGYRIELGEIEANLAKYHGVNQVVVLSREDKLGNKRLVAYIVLGNDPKASTSILRDFLKKKLPEYMIPSAFIMLESMPLNKNGKVDRLALAEYDNVETEHETKYVGPRSLLELKIVQVWEKLIGTQPIGLKDDFFDLGGSSLLAIRVVSEIEKLFKVKLPLQDLLQRPTIENVAEILKGKQIENERIPKAIGLQTSGDRPAFFCVSASLHGKGLEYVKLSRYLDSNQPVYTPYLGHLSCNVTIKDAATECVKNIKSFQPEGPYFLGGWCYGGYVAFEAARQLEEQGEKVGMLALLDTYGPDYGFNYRTYLIGRIIEFLRIPNKQKRSKLIHTYKIFRMRLKGLKRKSLAKMQASQNNESQFDMHHIKWFPKPLSCNIEVFKAKEQSAGRYFGEDYGWKGLALRIRIHVVPGNHLTFLPKYYKELGQCLDKYLKDAQKME